MVLFLPMIGNISKLNNMYFIGTINIDRHDSVFFVAVNSPIYDVWIWWVDNSRYL